MKSHKQVTKVTLVLKNDLEVQNESEYQNNKDSKALGENAYKTTNLKVNLNLIPPPEFINKSNHSNIICKGLHLSLSYVCM